MNSFFSNALIQLGWVESKLSCFFAKLICFKLLICFKVLKLESIGELEQEDIIPGSAEQILYIAPQSEIAGM
jgi:hypothetical protein